MGIGVARQQQRLVNQHRRVPPRWRAADARQGHARDHRLDQEQQEGAGEDGQEEPAALGSIACQFKIPESWSKRFNRSLLSRKALPVLFLGNLATKSAGNGGFCKATTLITTPQISEFPVNYPRAGTHKGDSQGGENVIQALH